MGIIGYQTAPIEPTTVITTGSPGFCEFSEYIHHACGQAFTLTTTAPSANRAYCVGVRVQQPVTIMQMAVTVVTQSGNIDVGIYDVNASLLVSAGATAVAAPGIQVFNVTDTLLVPGHYFLATSMDNTTVRLRGGTNGTAATAATSACYIDSSSYPLPSTGTPEFFVSTWIPWIAAYTSAVTV